MSHENPDLVGYPTSAQRAAGSVDLETMARFVDSRLDVLDVAWPAQLARPTCQVKPAVDQTGLISDANTGITMATTVFATAGAFTGTPATIIPTEANAGWYHINAQVGSSAASPLVGSVRRANIGVYQINDLNYIELVEKFQGTDFERGSTGVISNITIDAVAYLGPTRRLYLYMYHQNASNITIVAAETTLTVSLIVPKSVT